MNLSVAGLCFTDGHGLAVQHDPILAVLSYVIAAVGSYAAIEMIERWRLGRGATARYWQLAGAVAFGTSIWSMHFIGILAVRVGVPLTYAPWPTALSLLIAIAVVALGLEIVRVETSPGRVGSAGLVVGLGVAAMHYVGMSGVLFAGDLAYVPSLWGLSVLVAIAAATCALWLSLTLRATWQRGIAALAMGGAICAMHYTGMAATVFRGDASVQAGAGIPSGMLALAVALGTLVLILCALLLVAVDRRLFASAVNEALVLRDANGRMDAVLSNIAQGVCLFDGTQRLLVANPRYAEIYGLPPDAPLIGRSLAQILADREAVGGGPDMSAADNLAARLETVSANRSVDTVVVLKNGRTVAVHHQPMPDGGWVGTHEDITERRQAQATVTFLARHDPLTRLPNRVLFREQLEQAVAESKHGAQFALLCVDLDNFKAVNDTLGHPAGDALLQAVADRLRECCRKGDTVARLGGDEFSVIQLAVAQPGDALAMANRIVASCGEPFEIDGHLVTVGASVGAAWQGDGDASSETLLKNADIALYLAKTAGRGQVRFFEPQMDARRLARRALEADMRRAIAGKQFELFFQPVIGLEAGGIVGFEALVRWHHPTRGLVSPMEFIPVAEETGMIVAIGRWVLQAACFEAENWPSAIAVAVNLSALQFRDSGDLVASVRAALDASGLRPERLELEITETVPLRDTAGTLSALHALRAMGISIALDDFGTGHASLSYLRSFPFDRIKIDQTFVRDMETNAESLAIVRAIAGLAQSLRMRTTAEGVETIGQLDGLRREGCTQVQGFLFSQPRPANEVPSLIESLRHIGQISI
jgi:diguanylate cyclase (GGDEF)-like protein